MLDKKPRSAAVVRDPEPSGVGGDNGGTEGKIAKKNQKDGKAKKIFNPLLPRLLPIKEAGEYLGRTVWGMRELYWANKIPWFRDGKKIYFDRKDLDDYVEKHKTTFI